MSKIVRISNEQHRLRKAIRGAQGMTPMDALDEKINNATDAGATHINLNWDQDGTFRQIWNNEKPADEGDQQAFITLDGESKEDDRETIGTHSIGNFNANAVLAGSGSVRNKSSDGTTCNELVLELDKLADPMQSPSNCWTGNHEHQPQWKTPKNDSGGCEEGVTQDFNSDTMQKIPFLATRKRISSKKNHQNTANINKLSNYENIHTNIY